jgi:hypothetical protein
MMQHLDVIALALCALGVFMAGASLLMREVNVWLRDSHYRDIERLRLAATRIVSALHDPYPS